MPLFTVGIPTYNRASMLAQALDCLLQQTFQDFDILVSDNASTDATPQVVARYASPRLRYHRQETNIGPLLNFRFLGDAATGDWVVIHQDDDLLSPLFLERAAQAISRCPDLVLFGCDVACKWNGDEQRLSGAGLYGFPFRHGWDRPQPRLFPGEQIAALTLFETGLIPPAQAVRTDLFRRHFPRDRSKEAFLDRYLNGRVALEGTVGYEAFIGAIMRNHPHRYTTHADYDGPAAGRQNTLLLLEHLREKQVDWQTALRQVLPETCPEWRARWLQSSLWDPTIPPEALDLLAEDTARKEGLDARAYIERLRHPPTPPPAHGRLDRLPLPKPVIRRVRAIRHRFKDAVTRWL